MPVNQKKYYFLKNLFVNMRFFFYWRPLMENNFRGNLFKTKMLFWIKNYFWVHFTIQGWTKFNKNFHFFNKMWKNAIRICFDLYTIKVRPIIFLFLFFCFFAFLHCSTFWRSRIVEAKVFLLFSNYLLRKFGFFSFNNSKEFSISVLKNSKLTFF